MLQEPREVHRDRLGEFNTFERGGLIDVYFDHALKLYYEGGGLSATEVSDSLDLVRDGVHLIGRPLGEVLGDMADRGHRPDLFEAESLMFSSLGIALSSPFIDDVDENVRSAAMLPFPDAV